MEFDDVIVDFEKLEFKVFATAGLLAKLPERAAGYCLTCSFTTAELLDRLLD